MYCILVKEPLKYITVSFFISLQQEACLFESAAIKWKLQEWTKAQNWISFQFPLFSKIICIISALQYWPYVVLHHTFDLVVSWKQLMVWTKTNRYEYPWFAVRFDSLLLTFLLAQMCVGPFWFHSSKNDWCYNIEITVMDSFNINISPLI